MPRARVSRSTRNTQKGRAAKTLAVLIEDSGHPLEMPCSNCHRNGRHCVVDLDVSNSCSECVRRKVACDGVDVSARREYLVVCIRGLDVDYEAVFKSMKESRRLEDEEEKVMKDFIELQSKLMRIREQRRHLRKRQKELFDRGMADLAKELGGNDPLVSKEPATSEPGVALPEVGFDEWAQEQGLDFPEILSPDPLLLEVAGVGQETAGESSRSRSSG